MLYAIIAVVILIADQWLKYWVTVNITLATGSEALIPGVVKLVNIHNSGMSFGLLDNVPFARWLLIGLTAVMVVVIVILLVRRTFDSKFAVWCEVLVLAGALGNCIDRVLYGYVVDMFKLEFVNFAVFNIADIVLVVSCLMFIIYLLVGCREDGGKKPAKMPEPKAPADKFEEIFGIESTDPAAAVAPDKSSADVFGFDTSAAEFPAGATPIKAGGSERVSSDEFWDSFKKELRAEPPADAAPEAPVRARPTETPRPRPAKKPAPKAESYDLEDILAEFKDI